MHFLDVPSLYDVISHVVFTSCAPLACEFIVFLHSVTMDINDYNYLFQIFVNMAWPVLHYLRNPTGNEETNTTLPALDNLQNPNGNEDTNILLFDFPNPTANEDTEPLLN